MVVIKSPEDIEIMAEAGAKLALILKTLLKEVRPGIPTSVFDTRARELCKEMGVKPAFLGYVPHGTSVAFPAALCVSVNDSVVHGTPGARIINDGDVIKLDMGLLCNGFYTDHAVTVCAGKCSKEAKKLLSVTENAMWDGIKMARAGNTLGDIGWAVSRRVEKAGFSTVQGLTGHGIGRDLHEDPAVLNFGKRGQGEDLREGMVIAIEPMVAIGGGAMMQMEDDSYATRDGSLTAHFEHTVAITKKGPRVLTVTRN